MPARLILGGWEISGVTAIPERRAHKRDSARCDIGRIGASSARASVTGNPNLSGGDRTPARWFDTQVFVNPALMTPGVWGNSGRNILIGPGFQNWDLSLLKSIPLNERRRLQFRAESSTYSITRTLPVSAQRSGWTRAAIRPVASVR